MAILMITDASEDTLAHYDQLIKQLEAAGLGHPPGRQLHVAARKGTGYVVADVWDSQEAFDRFMETLGPMLEQVGVRFEQQQPQILPVHDLIKDQ